MNSRPAANDRTDNPGRSPNLLSAPPKRGQGVKRLNRSPLLIAGSAAMLMLAGVMYTVVKKSEDNAPAATHGGPTNNGKGSSPPQELLDEQPSSIAAGVPRTPAGRGFSGTGAPSQIPAPAPASPSAPVNPWQQGWADYEEATRQWAAEVRQRQEKALSSGSAVEVSSSGPMAATPAIATAASVAQTTSAVPASAAAGLITPGTTAPSATAAGGGLGGGVAGLGGDTPGVALGGAGSGASDPNGQVNKQQWALGQPAVRDYLPASRTPPLFPYEVKAGTVIPSTLISGINSDLPGQIIAQVTENVYDTKTGQVLLIPQGSKLIGSYNNQVAYGQERVQSKWNRIIYPNSASLDISGMPGADQSGYSGFTDQVDNHLFRVFGNAILTSLFSAGAQLSQNNGQSSNSLNPSASQVAAASLGQNLGQVGAQIAQKGIDIAPTLEIRPGYRFSVMVTQDIGLPPYED